MKKKAISLLLALVIILSSLSISGISTFALSSGDWEYSVSGGKATVTGYNGNATSVTIPSTLGGYPVEAVGGTTFDVEDYNLITINIPKGIKDIDIEAVYDLAGLENINVDSANANYSSINGVLFNKNKTKLVFYPAGRPDTSYTVPNGVTTIGESAFSEDYWTCKPLTTVNLPSSLKTIESHAFFGCEALTSIALPNGLTTIGDGAFMNSEITVITVPQSVISIGDLALGYMWIRQHGEERMDNFIIIGVPGSAAEQYAKKNKITFYEIGAVPDVQKNAWYYNAVKYVLDKKIMSGYQNGLFGPNDNLKRQDFVLIIARISGADLSNYANTTSKLKDVKKGAYYAAAVNWAVENGIIAGYQNGNFGVNDNITREQVATILYRYMGSPYVSNINGALAKFKDNAKVSGYAKTAVAWAVQQGIISGMADGRVAPTEGASRAQIASIIMRMDQQGFFS